MNISFQNADLSSSIELLERPIDSESKIPEWLNKIRLEELSDFSKQQIPTRKTEHWKYNDLSSITTRQYSFVKEPSFSLEQLSLLNLPIQSGIKFVFVDGIYSNELSSVLDESITATSFVNANDKQAKEIVASLNKAKQQKNLFIQLNSVTSQDGLLLEIASHSNIDSPIYMVHISTKNEHPKITGNQVIIQCGKGSQSQIIEHFINLADQSEKTTFACQQTILELADNSRCDHFRIMNGSPKSVSVSRLLARLQKDSTLNSFYYSEGSHLDKTDIDIWHQGSNSESNLTGIYLPSGENNVDFHTCIEHQVPHCNSRETFRGIIADSAKATFNGKIHIFRDAQKSDAQLSNKNLLLTNTAEINTKPELEIYADDVICAHGATIAKIDEKAIYYLKTRGINEMQAKKMLSIGFINELLEKVNNTELKQFLSAHVQKCLSNLK